MTARVIPSVAHLKASMVSWHGHSVFDHDPQGRRAPYIYPNCAWILYDYRHAGVYSSDASKMIHKVAGPFKTFNECLDWIEKERSKGNLAQYVPPTEAPQMSDATKAVKLPKFVTATRISPEHPYTVPDNAIWHPTDAEYFFHFEGRADDGTPKKIRGLVMDEAGNIFGYRNMDKIRVDSAAGKLVGRVSLGHESYQVTTQSLPFYVTAEPDTIVRVEVLVLAKSPVA